MAARSEVPSAIPSGQKSALDGPGARRMAPEERITALMDGLHSILEQAVESPSHWQVLLDASANLWRYSGGNVALLMMQMAQRGTDEPTLVAGYKEWERHGRTVLRGEHALWVIAPRKRGTPRRPVLALTSSPASDESRFWRRLKEQRRIGTAAQ